MLLLGKKEKKKSDATKCERLHVKSVESKVEKYLHIFESSTSKQFRNIVQLIAQESKLHIRVT